MLVGKSVTLRPLGIEDIDFFLKWFNNPEITKFLLMYLPMTKLSEEKWLREVAKKQEPVFTILVNTPSERPPIGACGLHKIDQKDRRAEFGIVLGEKNAWGCGFAREAGELLISYGFNSLNLHKIESAYIATNIRSMRLHNKLGFLEEGRKRNHTFKEGQYRDMIIFGLLREEWEQAKERKKKE
ncbi:MAG: GNAT family N-acetyltransferase [Candidatus Portnoybacteria bacterium]|nr:GNAT family N-acetyltransferase [Candidatus Portnoybacteria bacterium]